ncbi:MAG: methyl-accepting chemotaxis protein [Anaerolineae bacterium]|jgi:nitrogen fixation/metabolism regulation signal transduction histidine kinase|nr:methyl-accepting chemotaxis protein [Anaerolineae bacterium]MBT7190969.1 methyl-accepting chemotaxis protein [Anaerolineae bacterium]MBT7989921.1 methyl-accepting chemotaxis protein [Anaerolineae bacterium]
MKKILRKLRRKYFLRDSSQPRLLLGIELIFFTLLIVSGIIFYLVANQDLTASYYQAHLKIKNLKDNLLPILIGLNLAGLAVGAVLAVFFTHRISGPLYRLNCVMKEIGQGDFDHVIRFRNGDELKDVEAAACEMLRGLNERVNKLQYLGKQLEEDVGKLPPSAKEELAVDMQNLMQALAEFELKEER